VDYIVRQYQEDLSVEKIAAAVNLDPTYMQKLFRKAMGNTLFDYITQYRVSQSIALMRNTNMKFTDIAGEAGFNNRQNFYNAFKRFTGYTPKTFKQYLTIPVTAYTREE
jgi:AraC-like DNA-binding protein